MAEKRTDINTNEIKRLYFEEHWTQQEIADYYRVSRTTIHSRLNPDEWKNKIKSYRQTEKAKTYIKAYRKKYIRSEKGKAIGKAYQKHWYQSDNGKESYRKSSAARRDLGFVPLNKKFKDSHAHHIDKDYVIYIPAELHQSIYHSLVNDINMDKINALAFKYLFEHS